MLQKRNLLYLAATALLLAVGLVGSLLVLHPTEGSRVKVLQNGITIYCLDLEQERDRTIAVTYNGGTNLIEIKDHHIRILEADCPDQDCVKMSWLHSDGLPIVCLPNHLVIQFAQPSGVTDALA